MKIRTDFVTNSSSSSFITVTVYTKDNRSLVGGFDSGDNNIEYMEDGFPADKNFFENLKDGEELMKAALEWFGSTLCGLDEFDPKWFEWNNVESIKELNREDIKSIEIESSCDYETAGFNAKVTYDYQSKNINSELWSWDEDTQWEDEEDEEDGE